MHALNPEYVATFQSFVRGEAENASFARYLNSQTRREKASRVVDSFASPLEEVLHQSTSVTSKSTPRNPRCPITRTSPASRRRSPRA